MYNVVVGGNVVMCYNCEYLNSKDTKEGKCNGCLYYCTKNKKYVNGSCDSCGSYSKDILRLTYENNEIYNNGRKYYNGSDTPLSVQVIFVVILIIIVIITNGI